MGRLGIPSTSIGEPHFFAYCGVVEIPAQGTLLNKSIFAPTSTVGQSIRRFCWGTGGQLQASPCGREAWLRASQPWIGGGYEANDCWIALTTF